MECEEDISPPYVTSVIPDQSRLKYLHIELPPRYLMSVSSRIKVLRHRDVTQCGPLDWIFGQSAALGQLCTHVNSSFWCVPVSLWRGGCETGQGVLLSALRALTGNGFSVCARVCQPCCLERSRITHGVGSLLLPVSQILSPGRQTHWAVSPTPLKLIQN